MDQIYVKPVPRELPPFAGMNVKEVNVTTRKGKEITTSRPFNSPVLPNDKDPFAPFWDGRQYTIAIPQDIPRPTAASSQSEREAYRVKVQQWLNKLVAECGLVYPADHPQEGQTIEKANPMRYDDPFFSHWDFRKEIIVVEGSFAFDWSNALHRAAYYCMAAHPKYMTVAQEAKGKPGAYLITSAEQEAQQKKETMDLRQRAYELFSKVKTDSTKMRTLLFLMKDVYLVKDLKDEDLATVIFRDYIQEGNDADVELFIRAATMDSTNLAVRVLCKTATNAGLVIYNTTDGSYSFNDDKIAFSKEDLYKYFLNEGNASLLKQQLDMIPKEVELDADVW